jgi:uncharacterized membrane protein
MRHPSRPHDHRPETPHFRATLTPYRSATARQQTLVVLLMMAVATPAAVVFVIAGAWPVTGFMGLEIVLLFFAFRLNHWRGFAREVIEVSRARFRLLSVDPWGREREWLWTPAWIQVLVADTPKRKNGLAVRSHGETVEIGSFLTADERETLADRLKGALASARI